MRHFAPFRSFAFLAAIAAGCGADDVAPEAATASDELAADDKADMPFDPNGPGPRERSGPIRPAPSGLRISRNQGGESVTLAFSCGRNADAHRIERRVDGAASFTSGPGSSGCTGSLVDRGVTAGVRTCFRIVASNSTDSATSNMVCAVVDSYRRAPEAPNMLPASVREGDIGIAFEDQSRIERGYRFERRAPGGAWTVLRDRAAPHEGSGRVTEHDTSIGPSTSWEYRIVFYNEAGSTPSAVVSARSFPAAPSSFQVVNQAPDALTFRWNDPAPDETGFRVRYWRGGQEGNTTEVNVGANVTEKRVTGLAFGSSYCFKVATVRGDAVVWSQGPGTCGATTRPRAELSVEITGLSPNPAELNIPDGGPTRVSWRVRNVGESSRGHTTRIYVDGQLAHETRQGGIDGGDSTSASVVFSLVGLAGVGDGHVLTVTVDADGEYAEQNEQDNVARLTFRVVP